MKPAKEGCMDVITDGILIALYLWATVAVIKQGTWNKPATSCDVYLREEDGRPMTDCGSAA